MEYMEGGFASIPRTALKVLISWMLLYSTTTTTGWRQDKDSWLPAADCESKGRERKREIGQKVEFRWVSCFKLYPLPYRLNLPRTTTCKLAAMVGSRTFEAFWCSWWRLPVSYVYALSVSMVAALLGSHFKIWHFLCCLLIVLPNQTDQSLTWGDGVHHQLCACLQRRVVSFAKNLLSDFSYANILVIFWLVDEFGFIMKNPFVPF